MQHEFAHSDIVRVRSLVANYKLAFSLVPQYQGRGKPKGHSLDHLPVYLEKYGPFRGFWCFPYEAFLQEHTHTRTQTLTPPSPPPPPSTLTRPQP
jgi:hypothetical protein